MDFAIIAWGFIGLIIVVGGVGLAASLIALATQNRR